MLMVSLLWSGFSRMTELPIGLLLAECSGANLLEANWSSYQFICLMTWHPCPMLTDKTYSSHCSPLLSSVTHLLQVTEMKKAGWKWSWNSENAQEQCVNCVGRSGSVVKTCALIPTSSLLPGLFSLGKFPHSPASSSVTQTLNQLLPLDVLLIGGHSFFAGS